MVRGTLLHAKVPIITIIIKRSKSQFEKRVSVLKDGFVSTAFLFGLFECEEDLRSAENRRDLIKRKPS